MAQRYAASLRAVRELKADGSLPTDTKQRSSRSLNNLIEQNYRSVKQRIAVMLGFKQFRHAAITIAGIELMHRIHKGQFGLRPLGVRGRAAPAICSARRIKVTVCIRDAACSCSRFAPEPLR
jgi:transposase-like protein